MDGECGCAGQESTTRQSKFCVADSLHSGSGRPVRDCYADAVSKAAHALPLVSNANPTYAPDEGEMTENSEGLGAGTPDIPALAPELWNRPATLPGTVAVGGSRAESAANQIGRLAANVPTGERIGSKDDIRRLCGVSVGTVNEAIKLAQARGVITSRPGPGGGIFALDPSPLSRMNAWFRSAASADASLEQSIQIRDALAPLLVDEALAQITDADQRNLTSLMVDLRVTRDDNDVVGFVWAAWNIHEYFAGLGSNKLLDSLYLSIMDVGTSHLRARLADRNEEGPGHRAIQLDHLATVVEDLVDALCRRDANAAIDALRRTDPTLILQPDADAEHEGR